MHKTVEDLLQCQVRVMYLLECQCIKCSCASVRVREVWLG